MLGPHVLTFVWLCAEAEDFVPSQSNYCTSNLQTHDNACRIICVSLGRRIVWNVSVFTASLSQSLPKVSLVISCDMRCFDMFCADCWRLLGSVQMPTVQKVMSRSLWLACIILYDYMMFQYHQHIFIDNFVVVIVRIVIIIIIIIIRNHHQKSSSSFPPFPSILSKSFPSQLRLSRFKSSERVALIVSGQLGQHMVTCLDAMPSNDMWFMYSLVQAFGWYDIEFEY